MKQTAMHTPDHPFIAWPMEGLARIFPFDPPPRRIGNGWNLSAAQGEYCTFQLGIASYERLDEIEILPSTLNSGKHEIPTRCFRVRWAGLIPVAQDYFHAVGAERPEEFPSWYPDPLQDSPPWSGKKNPPPRSAGIHVTLRVPRGIPAGVYRGRLTVSRGRRFSQHVPVRVTVWPFAIPKRTTFHFSHWFHNDCVVKWHRCEPWSARHWRLLDAYACDMAAHRQNVISTATFIGNFHNHDPLPLVDVRRDVNGKFHFDMRRFERWVALFRRHGFDYFELWHLANALDGRTTLPFSYYDEKAGRIRRYAKLSTNSLLFRQLTAAFFDHLSGWLDRRNMASRFLLHIFDEPQKESWPRYRELSRFFRKHAPKLKVIDAISADSSDLATDSGPDIPVPLTSWVESNPYYRRRAAEGREPVWWYTCLIPTGRYANRFVSQPLICPRILSWQAFAFGVQGYLHWGYNFWHRPDQDVSGKPGINAYADERVLNPYREQPRFPVGDTCIVYPDPCWWLDKGPVSSLRYEAMREGLQDYELLRMLDAVSRERVPTSAKIGHAVRTRARRILRRVRGPLAGSLTEYTRNASLLLETRRIVGDCLAELTEAHDTWCNEKRGF